MAKLGATLIGGLLLSLLLLVGCSRPYDRPEIEEPGQPVVNTFPGLGALMASREPARVIWTHGMCTHDDNWVLRRIELVKTALGADPSLGNRRQIGGTGAYLQPVTFTSSQGSLQVQFLVWSPLTWDIKGVLNADRPGSDPANSFPYQRARLNNDLKVGLMNDCLSDAVIYGGPNGEQIRSVMTEAVCTALGGRIAGGGACDVTGAGNGPVAFVTESLGSKFLFDAVRRIWGNTRSAAARLRDGLAARLSSVTAVYMAANQIPLLDLAGQAGIGATGVRSSLAEFLEIVAQARQGGRPASKVLVVAFSDPNDLLSYRLLPRGLGIADARLVNVIVSNDDTLLGYLERPDTAHCGYAWNPAVVGILTRGYQAGAPAPSISVPASLSGSCF